MIDLEFLKSKPEDDKFHRSRVMFCIKGDRVEKGLEDTSESHIEWFKRVGWVTEENAEDFLRNNIRGFYLPEENKLYCYRDVGFGFDDRVLSEILEKLGELKEIFHLDNETEIHLGPKDSPIYGKEYPKVYAGKIKDLLKG